MKTLLLAFVLALVAAGCGGATITFGPVVDSYYPSPPPVAYYHRHYQYGGWYNRHYPGVLVCSRYQGCTWR